LLATVMVGGSLLGGAVLDVVGTTSSGYATIFVLTTGMRVVTLFLLASIEPSGLRLRHRTKTLVVRTAAAIPGLPSFDVDVLDSDQRDPPD
ncbi:MAG: hypothetical protein P8I44_13230, partial [Phycisphaerales bacterium]|nr:hypothetical protein [Phycisphaerales bacterium]